MTLISKPVSEHLATTIKLPYLVFRSVANDLLFDRRYGVRTAGVIKAGELGLPSGCQGYRPPGWMSLRRIGGAPGRRMILGLGTSVCPSLLDTAYVDEVVRVEEADTIRTCHRLAGRGFLFGGSIGIVVSGATRWLTCTTRRTSPQWPSPQTSARASSTPIYQTNWLHGPYGEDVFSTDELTAGSRSA